MAKKSERGAARPPMARMMRIHAALMNDDRPNATVLAEELEVSTKTVHRDIVFMRDQMNLPIEWDAAENGYFYNGTVDAFPTVQVTEGELFALLVAEKAVAQYRDTPFEVPLRSALQKLSSGLKDKIFLSLDHINVALSFKPMGEAVADLDVFQKVARAVNQSEVLEFEYKGLGDSKYRKRTVEPLHLVCAENKWYVVTHDLDRQAKRTFVLVRMRDVRLSGRNFTRPEDFDIREHLREAFGIFAGSESHSVRIQFDSFAARLIQEKAWHPAQEITDLADGGIEFRIKLSDLWEIERWVLSWGSHARVLAPAELKKRIRAHAKAMLAP